MIHKRVNTNGQQKWKDAQIREMQMKVKMRCNFINIGKAEIKKTSNRLLVGL